MIFGVYGAQRIDELVKIETHHVTDHKDILFVRIPKTKTKVEKSLTIHGKHYDIAKRYLELRPSTVPHKRLFVNYTKGKCTIQPIGKNKFAKMPQIIAEFLSLPSPKLYTGKL